MADRSFKAFVESRPRRSRRPLPFTSIDDNGLASWLRTKARGSMFPDIDSLPRLTWYLDRNCASPSIRRAASLFWSDFRRWKRRAA